MICEEDPDFAVAAILEWIADGERRDLRLSAELTPLLCRVVGSLSAPEFPAGPTRRWTVSEGTRDREEAD